MEKKYEFNVSNQAALQEAKTAERNQFGEWAVHNVEIGTEAAEALKRNVSHG